MTESSLDEYRQEATLDRAALEQLQRDKLARLLDLVRASNPFYRDKLATTDFDSNRDPLAKLPFTTRDELQQNQQQHPPFGTNLSQPIEQFTRFHQTSGTNGVPLCWPDTPRNWVWWKKCWMSIFDAAGVMCSDRVFFPFSFGPFVGFWSAFAGAEALGCLCIPGGGMTTTARLQTIIDTQATVICCTPTYAIRMAEVAAEAKIDISNANVKALIVAGEPGGSITATRRKIETAWNARVFDHAGMTEIGPWGYEHIDAPRDLHVFENEFIAEVIDSETGESTADGEPGELVLTNLGRVDSPLIRYRTGDQVVLDGGTIPGCAFRRAVGGIRGRIDDMLFIRGNNVFPSAIENILRGNEAIAEFRLRLKANGQMNDLEIEIEPHETAAATRQLSKNVEDAVRDALHFRPIVRVVSPGTLPRFEMKARRVVRESEQD